MNGLRSGLLTWPARPATAPSPLPLFGTPPRTRVDGLAQAGPVQDGLNSEPRIARGDRSISLASGPRPGMASAVALLHWPSWLGQFDGVIIFPHHQINTCIRVISSSCQPRPPVSLVRGLRRSIAHRPSPLASRALPSRPFSRKADGRPLLCNQPACGSMQSRAVNRRHIRHASPGTGQGC
jgi:hypothetical protein